MTQRIALLDAELSVINIGLEAFANDLRDDGVGVVHMDWRPPSGGDDRLASILAMLDDDA